MLAATAVILAGGKSSRMGYDKQCIKLNGKLIVEEQINKLKEMFKEVLVVTNKPELYKDKCNVAADILENFGPLGGIHAGLRAANNQYCYFIACDMPNINEDYILHMCGIINRHSMDYQAVVTRFGNWLEPFNAFYAKSLIPIIEEAYKQEVLSIGSVLVKANTYYIEEAEARSYSKDWSMFDNINTMEDLMNLNSTLYKAEEASNG